jgi:addiction module HigA family antidote
MTTETKLTPIHPGEILNEEFLVPMGITQYRLAKTIGVDARRIHAIVRGERAITAETAWLLASFFGNSASFWMGLQSQYDLEIAHDRLQPERLARISKIMATALGHTSPASKGARIYTPRRQDAVVNS